MNDDTKKTALQLTRAALVERRMALVVPLKNAQPQQPMIDVINQLVAVQFAIEAVEKAIADEALGPGDYDLANVT